MTFRAKFFNTVEADAFVGSPGDITYDVVRKQWSAHDGRTSGGRRIGPSDARVRQALVIPGGATAFNSLGASNTIVGTGSFIASDATNPGMLNIASAAVSGSDFGYSGSDSALLHFARPIRFQALVKLQEIAVLRYWFGVTSASSATHAGADDPAGDFAAFRFSTPGGDVNFQCATKDGTTLGLTDSGIVASTNKVLLEIFHVPGVAVYFYVNEVLVAVRTTLLPRVSVGGHSLAFGEPAEAVAKNLRVGWILTEELQSF